MQTVLIVIHLLVVLALIGVVLLQRSEGGLGLGGGGSGGVSGFLTGRGQANALTRATAVLATVFFITSLSLGWLAHRASGPRSILDSAAPPAPAQAPGPAPAQGGVLGEIERQEPAAPTGPQVPQSR